MIIGITGTQGAGKGTVVEELTKKGFTHYSARECIASKVKEQNLELTRDNFRITADSLRKQFGAQYVIEQLYLQAKSNGTDAIIESVRTVGEVEFLRKQPDFFLISIDADITLRYNRAIARKSELDHVSFEEFRRQEETEFSNTESHMMNIKKCMQLADIQLTNNGTIRDLQVQLSESLNKSTTFQ